MYTYKRREKQNDVSRIRVLLELDGVSVLLQRFIILRRGASHLSPGHSVSCRDSRQVFNGFNPRLRTEQRARSIQEVMYIHHVALRSCLLLPFLSKNEKTFVRIAMCYIVVCLPTMFICEYVSSATAV